MIKKWVSAGKMCRSSNNTIPQIQTLNKRMDVQKLDNIRYIRKNYQDYIGCDTPDKLLPFVANLCDGLRDIRVRLDKSTYSFFTLEEDSGVRTLEIIVPGGGKYNNQYRVFHIRNSDGKALKIGFSISPYCGANSEKTCLVIAVDNGHKCHHALQLILDTHIIISQDSMGTAYEITHNGKINVGRKGCAKLKEVIDFVKNEMPSLVGDDDKIHLGILHNTELITVHSEQFTPLFESLISYVLILEKFRELKLTAPSSFV